MDIAGRGANAGPRRCRRVGLRSIGREGEAAGERSAANKEASRLRVARGGRGDGERKPAQRAPRREKADE